MTKHTPTTPPHLRADGCQFMQRMCLEYGITDAGGLSLLERAAECVGVEAGREPVFQLAHVPLERHAGLG